MMNRNSSLEEILPIIRYNNACRDVQTERAKLWLEKVYIPKLIEKENKKRAELCSEFAEYNRQYEKAMDIIQEVVSLNSNKTLETERQFLKLSQEEYDLLTEVFESVGGDDE